MIDFKRDDGTWAFAFAWTMFVGAVDVMIGSGLYEAARSERFDSAPGVVTKSELKAGRKGSMHLNLEYTYTVNGQQHTGTKYHIQPQFMNNEFWIAAHDANPVGAAVTVYYDPAEPTNAYLLPGLRWDDVFIVWWLTPFNLVSIAFIWCGWWEYTRSPLFDPALARCVWETPTGTFVRADPQTRFLPNAFGMLGAVTFCGCFVAGIVVTNLKGPVPGWLPVSMVAVAVVVPILFGLLASRLGLIHIDEQEATVTFAHAKGRVVVPRVSLLGIDIGIQTRRAKSGSYEVYTVMLRWRDSLDATQSSSLAEYRDTDDALALVTWLAVKLDLPSAAQVAV